MSPAAQAANSTRELRKTTRKERKEAERKKKGKSAVRKHQIAELQSPSGTSEQPIESEPQIIGDWTPSLIPEPGSSSWGSCLEPMNDPFVVTGLGSDNISSMSMDSRYSSLGPYLDQIFGPPVVTSPEFGLGYAMNMDSEINPSAASPRIYGSMPAELVSAPAMTYPSPPDPWEGSNDIDFRHRLPVTEKDKAAIQKALEITRVNYWLRLGGGDLPCAPADQTYYFQVTGLVVGFYDEWQSRFGNSCPKPDLVWCKEPWRGGFPEEATYSGEDISYVEDFMSQNACG